MVSFYNCNEKLGWNEKCDKIVLYILEKLFVFYNLWGCEEIGN